MTGCRIAVHDWVTGSRVNGPGSRTVLWVQGCSLGCPGCFNPRTHEVHDTSATVASLLLELIAADPNAEGLTISGGEPLEQPDAIAELATGWRAATGTGVIILTGLTWEEIEQDPAARSAARRADLVIAGRYNERLRIGEGLRGSSNKTYHFLTDEYRIDQVTNLPEFEAVIGKDGTVHVTGVAGSDSLTQALRPQSSA